RRTELARGSDRASASSFERRIVRRCSRELELRRAFRIVRAGARERPSFGELFREANREALPAVVFARMRQRPGVGALGAFTRGTNREGRLAASAWRPAQ